MAAALLIPPGMCQGVFTTRVSVANDGSQGNAACANASVSSGGRYVAFQSTATNLVSGDTNGLSDIFVRDTAAGTTVRASVATNGAQANGGATYPFISANGRYVCFYSTASNLVSGDTNNNGDIFVRDLVNNTTTRVSLGNDGSEGLGTVNTYPAISGDGRYVAFYSTAPNLVAGDTNNVGDIFVRDTVSNTTTRVNVDSNGVEANNTSNGVCSISVDGRYIGFFSTASNLVSGDTNGLGDSFIRDRVNNTTTRVNVTSSGSQTSGGVSGNPAICSGGGRVAFQSAATNLVANDTNNANDIYLRDLDAGTTSCLSVGMDGAPGNGLSTNASISADGRYVCFYSNANNLVSGDTNSAGDIFVRDLVNNATTRVSVSSSGAQGSATANPFSISADGHYVVYASNATTLVSGDTNGALDVYLTRMDLPTGVGIPARFGVGSLLASQTRPTTFGDNLNELDQLFAYADGESLRLGITGNVADGQDVAVFLDTKSGGSNVLAAPSGTHLEPLAGTVFEAGFAPDYALDCRVSSGFLSVDAYDLQAQSWAFAGSAVVGSKDNLSGGTNAMAVLAALDNGNAQGITDASVSAASTAANGLEIWIPLTSLGISGTDTPAKVLALLQTDSNTVSNQTLPGLPDGYGDLGQPSSQSPLSFPDYSGIQYAAIGIPSSVSKDLPVDKAAFTYAPVVLTGNPSDNAAPAVASPPSAMPSTLYGGRSYAVDGKGNLLAVRPSDGALDAAFGSNGLVALDGPTTGRPVLKSIGGVFRLFVATANGTLYSMDALDGGNRRSLSLGGTVKATPAVMDSAGTAVIFVPVLTAGTWRVVRISDSGTLAVENGTPLVGVTDIPASPSLIASNARLQLGAVAGTAGRVYTIAANDLTIINGVDVNGPVKAPTTVSLDSARFFVGDAPASGDGAVYAFDASNGNPVTAFGANGVLSVSGGVDQAIFADYPSTASAASTLYFGTTAGALYAVRDDTGASAVSGFPLQLPGAVPVTGAVLFLKPSYGAASGTLYAPTSQGMFVVPTSNPGSYARYPATAAMSTPSATGRAAGSVVTATGGNGNVYGFSAQ